MKKVIVIFSLLVMVLGICACTAPGEPDETQKPKYTNYPQINDKLTWDKIRAFPIKSSDMTVDELRQLCVDFFRFTKTALWTPDEDLFYIKNANETEDEIRKGLVYGGLPYVGVASGNVYRLMDYIDEETGVVDLSAAAENIKLFGNQCSIGAYWGWGRVVNSADYDWTKDMVQQGGFLRVGPYTYEDALLRYGDTRTTRAICNENGMRTMFESYALLQSADGLVNYSTAGHVMMVSSEPVVLYNADGTINGAESYLTVIHQAQTWEEGTNDSGDTYQHKNGVDETFTFAELYEDAYLPFTFAEFLGTDPIEETQCTCSLSGETVNPNQMLSAIVDANYGLADVYANIKNEKGKTVYSCAVRAEKAGCKQLGFATAIRQEEWEPYLNGKYTVEIVAQLATGERPVIYTGKLVK